MDNTIPPSPPVRPDVVSVETAARPTPRTVGAPFSAVLRGGARAFVRGATAAANAIPGSPIMALALRGGGGSGMSTLPVSLPEGPQAPAVRRPGLRSRECRCRRDGQRGRRLRPWHQRSEHLVHARAGPGDEPLLPADPGGGERAEPHLQRAVQRHRGRAQHGEDGHRQHPLSSATRRRGRGTRQIPAYACQGERHGNRRHRQEGTARAARRSAAPAVRRSAQKTDRAFEVSKSAPPAAPASAEVRASDPRPAARGRDRRRGIRGRKGGGGDGAPRASACCSARRDPRGSARSCAERSDAGRSDANRGRKRSPAAERRLSGAT